jgi:phage-related protein
MKVALDVVKTVWPSIKKIISGVLDAIGGVIQVFSGIFTGDFDRMWDGVKGIFKGGVKIILGIVTGAAKGLLKAAKGLGGVIIDGSGMA